LGFRVLDYNIYGLRFRVSIYGFRVSRLGIRIYDLGFRV